MDSMRRLIENLNGKTEAERALLRSAANASTSAAAASGLTFKPGDQVLDTATGLRGAVRDAFRTQSTQAEVFQVTLSDGRRVHRGVGELEADAPVGRV